MTKHVYIDIRTLQSSLLQQFWKNVMSCSISSKINNDSAHAMSRQVFNETASSPCSSVSESGPKISKSAILNANGKIVAREIHVRLCA